MNGYDDDRGVGQSPEDEELTKTIENEKRSKKEKKEKDEHDER
jgi:hypothetical protein